MSNKLDALAQHSLSFLFTECQARLDGADLVVAVPSPSCRAASGDALHWGKPHAPSSAVMVDCEAGAHRRADRTEYPRAKPYAHSVEFRFRGAVWYGRVPLRDGWALCVQGAVRSLAGLPAGWLHEEAILVDNVTADSAVHLDGAGPVNGPHLPYP